MKVGFVIDMGERQITELCLGLFMIIGVPEVVFYKHYKSSNFRILIAGSIVSWDSDC